MSKNFIVPPCKRFGATHYDTIGYNTVRAHHSLQDHGCTRMQSLKFLTRTNCKIDATVNTVGPKKHNILRARHTKYLCVGGWDYGDKLFETMEPNKEIEVENIKKHDEILLKLERYDDKMRKQNQYNMEYQDRFLSIIKEQFQLPIQTEGKLNKILALKKQMRKMNKQNQETLSKISQQEFDNSSRMLNSSRAISSPKKSFNQLPLQSECDSVIQRDSNSFGNESPNLKYITDFKNKIFGSYIRRVSKQNSQPTLQCSQLSVRKIKPSKNMLLNSGIKLRESKTRTITTEKTYYSRNVFFPTESSLAKYYSLEQSQHQF